MNVIKKIIAMCVAWEQEYNHSQLRKKFKLDPSVSFYALSLEGTVIIGNHTFLNEHTRIDSGLSSRVVIGSHCAIGRFVHIMAKTHDLVQPTTDVNRPTIKMKEADVIIGDCVWIGDKVSILPGIVVGDYAVIGAHALVTKNVEPFEIVGGIPAKHIRFNTTHERYSGFMNKNKR